MDGDLELLSITNKTWCVQAWVLLIDLQVFLQNSFYKITRANVFLFIYFFQSKFRVHSLGVFPQLKRTNPNILLFSFVWECVPEYFFFFFFFAFRLQKTLQFLFQLNWRNALNIILLDPWKFRTKKSNFLRPQFFFDTCFNLIQT